jgi:hypothetical protein
VTRPCSTSAVVSRRACAFGSPTLCTSARTCSITSLSPPYPRRSPLRLLHPRPSNLSVRNIPAIDLCPESRKASFLRTQVGACSRQLLWTNHLMKHPNRFFGKGVLLSGPQNDLDATVLSVVKRPVSIGHFLKVHSMNNHERGINLTLFNKCQQLSRIPVKHEFAPFAASTLY